MSSSCIFDRAPSGCDGEPALEGVVDATDGFWSAGSTRSEWASARSDRAAASSVLAAGICAERPRVGSELAADGGAATARAPAVDAGFTERGRAASFAALAGGGTEARPAAAGGAIG